jgi:hypothetical protein
LQNLEELPSVADRLLVALLARIPGHEIARRVGEKREECEGIPFEGLTSVEAAPDRPDLGREGAAAFCSASRTGGGAELRGGPRV